MKYHFSWQSSGLGESDYRVSGAGDMTRLTVRYEATPYQRSIASCSDFDWQREVVASIGLLRGNGSRDVIPQELVDEFNAWRMAEYERWRTVILADYARYGVTPDTYSDAISSPPPALRGATGDHHWVKPEAREVWQHGSVWAGWQVNGETPADRLARLAATVRSYADKVGRFGAEASAGKRDPDDVERAEAELSLATRLLQEAQCKVDA